MLGKERAIFLPTGTLANHMAVRALAGGPSRVIVQTESHLYQDEGDCAQTLSALTLMPLGTGRATFTADEVEQVLDQTKAARVVPRVSVISIETPVRRKQGNADPELQRSWLSRVAKASGFILMAPGCFFKPPIPDKAWPTARDRSIRCTCRSTSISTRRPAPFSPVRATCSRAWFTCGACLGEVSPAYGRSPLWHSII
jgi:hypothetical protein